MRVFFICPRARDTGKSPNCSSLAASWVMMAVGGLIQDDYVANFVLREMHRELIQQINVDEITIHLISAGMLTDAQQDALQSSRRGATDRTKYLLSNEVLGGRGFRGLSALLDALRDNQLYKPNKTESGCQKHAGWCWKYSTTC